MAAMNPQVDERTTPIRKHWMAVLVVVFTVSALLVLIVTTGMLAFVDFAKSRIAERKTYGVVYDVQPQRAAELQRLEQGQRDDQGAVVAIPISEAMRIIVQREGGDQPTSSPAPPSEPERTDTHSHSH